jgi:MOB kinase activator 1
MTWVQSILEDETVFPTNDGMSVMIIFISLDYPTNFFFIFLYSETPFPKTFRSTVKNIFKRLFRIYAHIYYSHAQEIVDLGVEAHLNTAFKHFYLFIREFDLVEQKEMAPLEHTIGEIDARVREQEKDGEEKN